MLIDWFTVGAQVVNFLILVWLLKRFLYGPILQAIATRERRIADELAAAQTATAAAQAQQAQFEQKNAAFEQTQAQLMAQFISAAKVEQERLMAGARAESDTLRVQWQNGLRAEYRSLSAEISRRTQEEVFAMARKTLADLADASLEARMVEVFIRRVQETALEPGSPLAATIKDAAASLQVSSAYVLSAEQRSAIVNAITAASGVAHTVAFKTEADLVCGIELTANGHRVAWSIADYLGTLQQKIDDLLNKGADTMPDREDHHG